jgi:hypothetical protein
MNGELNMNRKRKFKVGDLVHYDDCRNNDYGIGVVLEIITVVDLVYDNADRYYYRVLSTKETIPELQEVYLRKVK